MTQIIIAIAALCGTPTANGGGWVTHSPSEVLQCQKYYISCLMNSNPGEVKSGVTARSVEQLETRFPLCLQNKKELGGSK